MIYLDHNATTPLLPAAREAMRAAEEAFGNPASGHRAGRRARRALEDARETVARLLGAGPDEVVFTGGATEANNLAVFGLAGDPPGRVLASPIEHPCVTEPLRALAGRGYAVEWLPVDRRGVVSGGPLAPREGSDSRSESATLRFAAVMLANHETGAVQPVADVVRGLPGVPVHCDAAQAAGKLPIDFRRLGVATLALSAHKFGGPVGVGALLVRDGVTLAPLMYGGHQQRGRRPGTEPVAPAVGLAAALDHSIRHMAETTARLADLRGRLLARLEAAAGPVAVNGPPPGDPAALPTTLNVSFPGLRADLLVMALDLAGVACSAGAACASGSVRPSPVLAAMGVPDDVLRGAVRFSLGATTTAAEIDAAAERVAGCVARMRVECGHRAEGGR
jgi:cysteine desulfurase